MARAVVLGGRGFIGSNLVKRLVGGGHDVTSVDIQWPKHREAAGEGARQVHADLSDRNVASRQIDGAEWVFHLAADMGGVGYFHSSADLGAALTNGLITNNVLTAAYRHQTPRLFYTSSACAYPIELQQTPGLAVPLHEALVGRGTPDALYGTEKLHGLRLCSKVPGARVGILHTVYGPLQEHEGRRMKFPAAVATKAITARATGTLELWGDGSQLRSYLYIDDAVDRIMRVMEAEHYDGPVNIGASGAVSCRDLASVCLTLTGVPEATIVTNPNEPSGVLARDCDNTKFAATYGPVVDTTHEVGFGKFIESLPQTATRPPARNAMRPKPTPRGGAS